MFSNLCSSPSHGWGDWQVFSPWSWRDQLQVLKYLLSNKLIFCTFSSPEFFSSTSRRRNSSRWTQRCLRSPRRSWRGLGCSCLTTLPSAWQTLSRRRDSKGAAFHWASPSHSLASRKGLPLESWQTGRRVSSAQEWRVKMSCFFSRKLLPGEVTSTLR